VIPVLLDERELTDVPYGLRLKHGARVTEYFTLQDVADSLLEELPEIRTLSKKAKNAKPRESTPPVLPASKLSLNVSVDSGTPEDVPDERTLRYGD
jgi:hypothetical protein